MFKETGGPSTQSFCFRHARVHDHLAYQTVCARVPKTKMVSVGVIAIDRSPATRVWTLNSPGFKRITLP
jgi:hypothetical protein